MRAMGKQSASQRASTWRFAFEAKVTSSSATTKIKEERTRLHIVIRPPHPEMVNTRVSCNLQWRNTRRGCWKIRRWHWWRGAPRGCIKSVTEKEENETVVTTSLYYVHGWMFSEVAFRDARQRRIEKGKEERERERKKQRDWNVSWSCEWIYIIASTTPTTSFSQTESPSTAETDPRYWIS